MDLVSWNLKVKCLPGNAGAASSALIGGMLDPLMTSRGLQPFCSPLAKFSHLLAIEVNGTCNFLCLWCSDNFIYNIHFLKGPIGFFGEKTANSTEIWRTFGTNSKSDSQ